MEENIVEVDTGSEVVRVVVDVENVTIAESQIDALVSEIKEVQVKTDLVHSSLIHMTSFLILLCVFQCYGLLSRARKKGGV